MGGSGGNVGLKGMVIIITVLTVILLSSLIGISLMVLFSRQNIKYNYSTESPLELYRTLSFNPTTKEVNVGFAKLKSNEESIFYTGEDGNLNLISNFETNEYVCTGSCYCESSERRSSSTVVRNGLFFLVASLTSLVAYQKAKDYFDEECQRSLSHDCEFPSAIMSNVDDCDKAKKKGGDVIDLSNYRKIKEERERKAREEALNSPCDSCGTHGASSDETKPEVDDLVYLCNGQCLPVSEDDAASIIFENPQIKQLPPDLTKSKYLDIRRGAISTMDCSKIELSRPIHLPSMMDMIPSQALGPMASMDKLPSEQQLSLVHQFFSAELNNFCFQNGIVNPPEGAREFGAIHVCEGFKGSLSMNVLGTSPHWDGSNSNPSLKCVKYIKEFGDEQEE